MNNKAKIVNKFGKDRATGEALFTDISKTALGEIVIVNDSKLPAILIKDNNMETHELHPIVIKGNADTNLGDIKVANENKNSKSVYTIAHGEINVLREEETVPEDNITILTDIVSNPLGHITKIKTGKISFKTINDEIANIREELDNVGGEYGTAIEMVDDVINVKVQKDNNFIEVNEDNELVVDSIDTNKTVVNESITIAGGPLAELAKKAYPDGVLPKGTDIQSLLTALLCVEIYPTATTTTGSYSVTINSAPSISADYSNGSLVEVGQPITFSSINTVPVTISQTNPKVSGLEHGYSDTIDGEINTNKSISSEWEFSQKTGSQYTLKGTISGFLGDLPGTWLNRAGNDSCSILHMTLFASEGANTLTVTENGPTFIGSVNGIGEKYIVSNLGNRDENKKSNAITAQSNIERTPVAKTSSFKITGVYPIYTNGVSASTIDGDAAAMGDLESPVENYDTKLKLVNVGTEFAISFAHQDLEPYSVCLPSNWKISSAKAIDPLTKTYADDCTSKFIENGTITKIVQGAEVTYTIYSYGESAGPNRVKFIVG